MSFNVSLVTQSEEASHASIVAYYLVVNAKLEVICRLADVTTFRTSPNSIAETNCDGCVILDEESNTRCFIPLADIGTKEIFHKVWDIEFQKHLLFAIPLYKRGEITV